MLLVLLTLFCGLSLSTGFRGPHHPNSHVLHHHAKPEKTASLGLNTPLIHDVEHLKEDLGPLSEKVDVSNMVPENMDFYYFKVHDVDNNSKLDGLEMMQALQHIYDDAEEENEKSVDPDEIENRLNFITELVDNTLKEHDLDNDGYLGYAEFRLSRNSGGL